MDNEKVGSTSGDPAGTSGPVNNPANKPNEGGASDGGRAAADDALFEKEAFQKLLREKKNAQARLKELEDEREAEKQKTLTEGQKYKELHELSVQKNQQLQAKLDAFEKKSREATQSKALKEELRKLGANEKYLDFLTDSADKSLIKYDEDLGVVYGADAVAKSLAQKLEGSGMFKVSKPTVGQEGPDLSLINTSKSLKEMSIAELQNAYRNIKK